MQRFPTVCVVAVWLLVLLRGGTVRSDETCAKSTTTKTTTTTTTTTTITVAPTECKQIPTTTATHTTETVPTPTVPQKCGPSDSEVSSAQLHGTWKVMAGYSRELVANAFCPGLTLHVNPVDSKNMTVTWSKAEPYENIIPQGEMTMKDNGYLVDNVGFHELKVIKLDKFLVLRVRNANFWRAFILSRVPASDADADAAEDPLGSLLEFMMTINSDLQSSDGPAWYICAESLHAGKPAQVDR
ncbi:Protein of unknown function [Gryllus bimaculatus]|nr:Protein of unknown function [Gryllus bimaculatus]